MSRRPSTGPGAVDQENDVLRALTAITRALEATPGAVAQRYAAGRVIADKYRLERLLGEGGMGSVWLATHLALEAEVAVKLIRHEAAGPEAGDRLLLEARAIARVDHPAVVRVFDFGETEQGDPFIVMEHLAGCSLADLLDQRGRIPADQAVQTLLPVCSALAAAHDKGVIHRDLKPENLVLAQGEGGRVLPKVVDFGIAKLRDHRIDGHSTRTGAVVGSPGYMSPEQARGKSAIDERTDVWALSVVLYEALVGQIPFDGPNYNAVLAAVLEDAPRPITDYGAGDAELWAVIERGLAKDPNERHPTMRQLGEALADWALDHGVETDVTGSPIALGWPRDTPIPLVHVVSQPPSPVAAARSRRPGPALYASAALASLLGLAMLHGGGPRAIALPELRTGEAGAPATAEVMEMAPPPALVPAVAETPSGPGGCFERMFPDDSFVGARAEALAPICEETDPRHGASLIRTEVVRASGGRVTEAMREWAVLGWYEMAALAVIRGRCCASPAPLRLPAPVGTCAPLDGPLDDLGRAETRADAEDALARYTAAVHCSVVGGGSGYPYGGHPEGAAPAALTKTLDRARP